jgi:predicted ATPase/DNA-binding winged helix-turn-helix (wHTH) protein
MSDVHPVKSLPLRADQSTLVGAPLQAPVVQLDWVDDVVLCFDQFTLLPAERRLQRSGEDVRMGARTFDVLAALIERAPGLVSKPELLRRVWPGLVVEEINLRFQVRLLRKALGDDTASDRFISTVHGRGYCFVANVSRVPRARLTAAAGPDDAFATNLPLPMHPIVDRERELDELAESLQRHRLVTVIGSGGVGKTRLAIELGRRVLPRYPDGVWLVDLAPLSDPALIASATATVLNLSPGDATAETLARWIGKRKLLLIFDNCEHLVDRVARLVEILVSQAGTTTVLATSQESLRVAEEQIYALQPLSLAPVGAAEIIGYGAVSLFVELARRADRRFAISAENAESVAEICRRLDGVPLALEMAAARLPLLGIQGLLSGLAERLNLLKGDPRRSERRHPTLRHVAGWSYSLLDSLDQKVFCRLAIFRGTVALDSVVAIMAPLGLDRWQTLDALWRLREKSLVVVEQGAAPRYRLLETLRLYALEELWASGDSDAVAETHARHFADVVQRAEAAWEMMPDLDWIALYQPEIDNLRAALDWALAEPKRRQLALALAAPSLHLLRTLSLIAEGRRYGERLVALIDGDTLPTTTLGLLSQAAMDWSNLLGPGALDQLERSLVLCRELDDPPRSGKELYVLASFLLRQGRAEEAKAVLIEAWDLIAPSNFKKARLKVMIALGVATMHLEQFDESRSYLMRSLQVARDLRSLAEPMCLTNLSVLEYRLGYIDRAIERAQEAIVFARAAPASRSLGWPLANLAAYLLARDSPGEARPFAEEAFACFGETNMAATGFLQIWAALVASEGRLPEAAQLIGFVDAERVRSRQPRLSSEQLLYDQLMRRLEIGLPVADLLARKAEGSLWSEDEALGFTATRLVTVAHSTMT